MNKVCGKCGQEGQVHVHFRHEPPKVWRCIACGSTKVRGTGTHGERRFGLEIEFIGDPYALERELRARGIAVVREAYNHTTRSHWKIVPDGSLGRNGAELVSPILRGDAGREQVRKVGAALSAAGCRVDRSTGLHVHHDVRNLGLAAFKRLVRNWADSQDAIDQMVARSRRRGRNEYCRRLTTGMLMQVDSLSTMDRRMAASVLRGCRYRTLNFQSYGRYGTVEIRQHQGTIDAKKILAWVAFGQAMIAAAVAGQTLAHRSGLDLLLVLGHTRRLNSESAAFLADRVTRLNRQEVAA